LTDERFRITVNPEQQRATLAVLTDRLDMPDGGPFSAACTELLESGQPELFLDLYAVEHIPSTVVAEVLKLYESALARGMRLRVACRELASRVLNSLLSGSIELV
jgi:anti-anti-sigma regulatory factor